MYNASDLVKFAESMVGMPYWYGTCVYKCSSGLLNSKSKQYPAHYTSSRMSKYRDAISKKLVCTDCVGLIKGFFWTGGGDGVKASIGTDKTFSNRYASNGMPDTSANGLLSWCKSLGCKNGTIGSIPDVPGIAVFMSGHVGVYVGGGYVVEARGFAYGVVKTRLKDRPWKNWAFLPSSLINYDGGTSAPTQDEPPELRNGSTGEYVRQLQRALIAQGYECGTWGVDGDFGDATELAVRAFQRDHRLDVDGIVGAATWAALADAAKAPEPETPRLVEIVGGNCYARSAPNTSGTILGVAYRGQRLAYQGQTSEAGWLLVEFDGKNAWISGKYGRLI